ncbi:1-phosphofructokinase [Alkalihalobacillus sp. 1P02AB]|uniref:1-phosphofructokinase n=1 Tax=Alkalihalobacillus sp. 1P02AB TaxID=3132260 RepID=UPI0039A72502
MITTITLNLALDKTYFLSNFQKGKTNRIKQVHEEPGGKGINVAKVLQTLGYEVKVSGFSGGFTGSKVQKLLNEKLITHQFIQIEDESRECINLIADVNGQETELLEQGPTIQPLKWEELCQSVQQLASQSEFVVLSGSLPKGVPINAYGQLINIIHQADAKTILDTSGEPFQAAISEKPFLIKPNEHELAHWLGKEELSRQDMIWGAEKLHDHGIPHVCLSLGANGVFYIGEKGRYSLTPPLLEVKNTVGCGDAMVAGLTAGFLSNLSIEQTLKLGIACGMSNALHLYAGCIKASDIKNFQDEIKIEKLS